MVNDPCQSIIDELREATEEWVLWSQRSTLPPSIKTVDEVIAPSATITPQLMHQLDENKKKADIAWARYRAAIEAIGDCRRQSR